jgi:CBS domain-containing protein
VADARRKGSLSSEAAIGLTVGEVMISRPKTLPADALVGDARRLFERPNLRTLLLVDNGEFRGAVERDGLPAAAADTDPVARFAEQEPVTATADMPMNEAVLLLERQRERRLVVLDDDGVTLRGLVCANSTATGFCVQ